MFLLWRCDSKPQKLPKTSTEHDKQTKMLTELPQTPLQSIRCRNKHPTFIPTEVPLCCPKGPKGATTKHGSWHHSAPPARSETFNVRGGSLHNVEVVVFNVAAELCKVGHLSFCKNVSVLWQWPLDGTVHHYIEIRGRWKNPVWENPAAAGSVLPLLCDNIYIYFFLKKWLFCLVRDILLFDMWLQMLVCFCCVAKKEPTSERPGWLSRPLSHCVFLTLTLTLTYTEMMKIVKGFVVQLQPGHSFFSAVW